ncbi:hypothetical protein BB561_000869 [Smittium simulii]|uniref:Trehalase n=1 Tax=Smittium simulii TaxID=133385 RepID=A0A2T9YXC6_9FUNG|nr:hypothetical protein BB561_000869 [Smittium simulii]
MKQISLLCKFALVPLFSTLVFSQSSSQRYPCDSQIFCHGNLLHTVQMSGIFDDDKTFVDKPTLKPEAEVLAAFAKLGDNPTKDQIRSFVTQNFGDEDSLLKTADLKEWKESPRFLDTIKDKYIRGFADSVNKIWKDLIRVQDKSKLCEGCVTSMLDISGNFVVPGGRFREFYYWDTYFTLEGLLASELYQTSKDMIQVLLDTVSSYGFVPNGARKYYLNRSQPPLLAHMVELYYEKTKDIDFVINSLPILKKEYQYWTDNHLVKFKSKTRHGEKTFKMFNYNVKVDTPRPEGYAVDYHIVNNATSDPVAQRELYAELASGAESGHDYTARWASNPNLKSPKILSTMIVTKIIPSDLNAIMYNNERIIANLSRIASKTVKSAKLKYNLKLDTRFFDSQKNYSFKQIMHLLFDESTGLFMDYNIASDKHTEVKSLANVWPYWYLADKIKPKYMNRAFEWIENVMDKSPGGLPATLVDSGLQWDFPDVWPPLQYAVVKGIQLGADSIVKNNKEDAQKYRKLALKISNTMVGSSYCAWYRTGGSIPGVLDKLPNVKDNGHIFEKFNSTEFGNYAGGGEYTVQSGFGWTNGVIFWMLQQFGQEIAMPICPK